MRKYLCMIIMVCALCLTGCGKEEVAYDAKEITDAERNEGQKLQEKDNETDLKKALGIEEDKWVESIGSGSDKVVISAKVEVPDTTDMYTQVVTEDYYTKEEQKKVADYFMDDYDTDDGEETAGDGAQTTYTGSKGDIEYTLSFDMDEESNTSAWKLKAVDGNDFSTAPVLETDKDNWCDIGWETVSRENQCELTREQAGRKAEEICRQLGIKDMKSVAVCDLIILLKAFPDRAAEEATEEEYGIPYELNGYCVVLVRDVYDVAVDGSFCYGDRETYDNAFYDDGTLSDFKSLKEDKNFDDERVMLKINDKGIISMTCMGSMTAKDTKSAAKLLNYAQIKELFLQKIEAIHAEGNSKYEHLYLMYKRVVNEKNPDEYCYIPVWCLTRLNMHDARNFGIDTNSVFTVVSGYNTEQTMWLNAIDRTEIIPDKAGFLHYTTAAQNYFFDTK